MYANTTQEPRTLVSTEDFTLKARFDDLANQLKEAADGHLDLPIAHWAVASDRRLPYALLDRTVRQLVASSFDSLLATPGVGRKKFAALVVLMQRALDAKDSPVNVPTVPNVESVSLSQQTFAPELVSQVVWADWQETVRRHQLQDELLGRLVPTLKSLPTVIWKKPLGEYLRYTIDELRSLKTHGDKRVTVVLEVFHLIHSVLGSSHGSKRIVAQLTPAFVPALEQWLVSALASETLPTAQDIRQHLVLPLLNQVERDAGETVHRLAAGRLGVEAFPEGVRDQALELGVTRARIYQLLETCGDVMQVRWPTGRWMFELLHHKIHSHAGDCEATELLGSLQWLLYPVRRSREVAEPAIA